MPVVDGIIQLPTDGSGKKQDFSIVTTSLGSVYRERINIADPITNNLVNVSAAGGLQVDGSGVTQPVSIAAAIDVSDRIARLLGHVTVDNASIAVTGTFWQATQPISGNVGITGAVDVSDRAARLVGHVTVDNFPATEDVSDRTARLLGHVTVDSAPTTAVTQNTSPWVVSGSVGITGSVDVSDRAARLLGIVYGSNAQLKQTATNNNLQTEIAVGASLIDPRSIRALTSADVVDISDRSARLLGHTTIDNASIAVTGTFFQGTQPVSGTVTANQGGAPWSDDVTDRSARLLGHVTVDNASIAVTGTFFPATQPVSGTVTANQGGAPWSEDVTDRAARLLGVVYGSQGQQLKQTATNFNLQTELATGATLYDARQIRALTSGDVVDVSDRSARLVGHVTVDSMPAITTSSSPTYMLDEYSNKIPVSDETLPWQQALLDEMRATRLGMQVLVEYLNPASGTPSQPLNQVRVPVVANVVPTEVDLMQWAQSIRDGGDELIQG